jgi:hypothetical protein
VTAPAQTPDSAPAYLEGLSPDVRAAVLLQTDGAQVAHAGAGDPAEVAGLVAELLENVDRAAGERTGEVEVVTGAGTVFAVRGERFVLAAVATRLALSSLLRWDMRHVLGEVERA